MAVTFTSNYPSSPTIIIGGDNNNPFPSYSIERQEIYSGDDTYVGTTFAIDITGTVVVDGDPTIGGQLHNAVHQAAIQKLDINDIFPTLGFGELIIESYGGTQTTFTDARIISISAVPADETSLGIKFQEYSISFEARSISDNSIVLDSVEESWSFSANNSQFCYPNDDPTGTLYKTYTLTHNLSAVGKHNPGSTAVEAWRNAVLWIKRRLIDDPKDEEIQQHINRSTAGPKFVPFYMNSENSKSDLKINADTTSVKYKAYNGSREINSDLAGGSYSVTDTWVVALDNANAVHTVSSDVSGGQEQPITVSMSVEISGLNSKLLGGNASNKNDNFDKAKAAYELIKGKVYGLANEIYLDTPETIRNPNNSSALLPNPISRSVSENRANGTITLSETYHDLFMFGNTTKIAQQDVNVQYKNYLLDEQVIAIIPVIDRPGGPVIQNFNTENVRSVSVTVSLVMNKDYKDEDTAHEEAKKIADSYKPQDGYVNTQSYDYTDDYGLITFNKEWLYK